MTARRSLAFFGSSLVSAYWNGAATYYRGILEALSELGYDITFYEPNAFERQEHRDIDDPDYAKVVVYQPTNEAAVLSAVEMARDSSVVVKASGVGVYDSLLQAAVIDLQSPSTRVLFWDVDAPATLKRLKKNPNDSFRKLVGEYDAVFTYGGGPRVVEEYTSFGARRCVPIYNALDPKSHHPVQKDTEYQSDLALLANRMPDRELRIAEFFFKPARELPSNSFILGGSGWQDRWPGSPNVRHVGHVYTGKHNAFNCTPRAVLNVNKESMARFGYSPATRVFEAAGAAACLITDKWDGIEDFLVPGEECLVVESGEEVAKHLDNLSPEKARKIGSAAFRKVRAHHTYANRAKIVDQQLNALFDSNGAL